MLWLVHSSDTSDENPDPNLSPERLYQDIDHLSIALSNSHFEEGLIYTMTLSSNRENFMLVWIIEANKETFVFQCFFNEVSKTPTWHESGKNKNADMTRFGGLCHDVSWYGLFRQTKLQSGKPYALHMGFHPHLSLSLPQENILEVFIFGMLGHCS